GDTAGALEAAGQQIAAAARVREEVPVAERVALGRGIAVADHELRAARADVVLTDERRADPAPAIPRHTGIVVQDCLADGTSGCGAVVPRFDRVLGGVTCAEAEPGARGPRRVDGVGDGLDHPEALEPGGLDDEAI